MLFMKNMIVYNKENVPNTAGTHKLASLQNVGFTDLVQMFGSPTFKEPSGDNKVQVEWVIKHDNSVYTIYDWKTYDVIYTLEELDTWSIGGKGAVSDKFISDVFKLCDENCSKHTAEVIMFHSNSGLLQNNVS